jgi:hypothetical protein
VFRHHPPVVIDSTRRDVPLGQIQPTQNIGAS